jgi:uroporphyrinogen decarboxylase
MGTLEGTRDYTRHPVQAPEDWQRLAVLDPDQGKLGEMLEALRLIGRGLDAGTPFIQTIFSPLSQVKNLVGKENLPVHLRRYPDVLHAALEVITETTVRFVKAVCETRVVGVFYAIQQAQYGILTEDEFTAFGRYYDLQVLEAAQDLWLNVLHVHGEDVMFDLVADYPVQVINWHDRDTRPSLAEAQGRFEGALCGGLQRWSDLVRGTPDLVRQRAQDALTQTGGRNFILGTGCVTPVVTPLANIRAAREVFA